MKKFFMFLSLFLILFSGTVLEWIGATFSRINFDEVMISMNSGIHDADAGYIHSFINHTILTPIIVILIVLFLTIKFNKKIVLNISFITSFIYLCFQISKIDKGSLFSKPSDFYEKEYVFPKDVKITFSEKRNVLLIALESIEKSYQNKKLFGEFGLIPNIENLEKQNISFPDYVEYDGMTFTIGAIMGMIAGVPLVYNGSGRTIKALNAIGVGNILLEHGYNTYSFFSSSGKYTNKEASLLNKGFAHIIGGDKIKKTADDKKVYSGNYYGGVDDLTMFENAKKEIQKINKNKPYFIFMETINTHIDGYHMKSCETLGFKQRNFDDIVKCEDKIITDFIEWFRKFDSSAVIIFINDHNTKNAKMNKKLERIKHRALSNAFIGTDIFESTNLNRKIMATDFFPTIVEAAGGNIPGCRLGLGTSLSKRCENVKTLRERYRAHDLHKLLGSKNKLYNNLMGVN